MKTSPPPLRIVTAALALLCAARASAEQGPPVVLVVRSAATDEGRKREVKLMDQLVLALDGFMLLSQEADRPDFTRLSLADQIADVLPEAKRNDAMAVVWMSFPLANQVMLHLVALGSGRTLVRTIETDRSPVSERTLALMARELLGTAYLLEPPSSIPAEVKEVVRDVKKEIPSEPEPVQVEAPPAQPPPPAPWSAWVRVQTEYPLDGGEDAVPILYLALLGERQVPYGADLSFGVTGSFASISRTQISGASFFTLGAKAALFRGWPVGAWSLGPIAEGTLSYGVFASPGNPAVTDVIPTLALGPHLRSERKGASLGFTLAAAYSMQRGTFGPLGGSALYRTPLLALQFAFSVGWQGI